MNPYVEALNAINEANLQPVVLRLANRLLAIVHEDNGYVSMSWDAMMATCGVRNRGSVWKYLGALKAAGIIHYDTNDAVDVAFEAWRSRRNERVDAPKRARGRAETSAWTRQFENDEDSEKTTTRPNERVDAPKRARGRAENATPIGLVGRYRSPTSGDLSEKTNQPKPVLDAEQNRSRLLLLDPEIGLSDGVAARLAAEHSFEWLLRQVFAWRDDIVAGRVDGPGALVNRIDRNYGPGDLTERDRASPLYQRHVSEEQRMEEVHRRYVPDEFSDIIRS